MFSRKFFINPFKDGHEFAMSCKKTSRIKKRIFLTIFLIVSFITILSTLTLGILSTLKLAKLWLWNENNQNAQGAEQLLNDYIYIINTINACVAFIGSISSFFAFKDGYLRNRTLYRLFDFEILLYNNRIGNYYGLNDEEAKSYLTDRMFQILGKAKNINKLSQLEDEGAEDEQSKTGK